MKTKTVDGKLLLISQNKEWPQTSVSYHKVMLESDLVLAQTKRYFGISGVFKTEWLIIKNKFGCTTQSFSDEQVAELENQYAIVQKVCDPKLKSLAIFLGM